jgi:hypothetical protein
MPDPDDRTCQVNVRLSRQELARIDQEIKRRETIEPGLSLARGEVARMLILRGLDSSRGDDMAREPRDAGDRRDTRKGAA